MAIEFIATGRKVPSRRVSNLELARQIDTTDQWIRSHTGIGARHIAADGESSSTLALAAAQEAIAMAAANTGASPEEAALSLDLIVVSTATPDHYCCPATACLVQAGLGARNAAALDLNAGCTGFIYALETTAGLLKTGKTRKRALVIGAETLTRVTNWEDRSTCVLFGDGAGAVILEKNVEKTGPGEGEEEKRGLLTSVLGADGSGAEYLIVRRGGSRNPFVRGEVVEQPALLEMNGQAVYNFAVKAVTGAIEALLAEAGLTLDDIARIIPHQANARIVAAAAKRLGVPEEKFFLNIEEYANTSSASIPIALDELNRSGALKRGDLLMTIGFGAGLTYGGNLIRW